MKDMISNIVFVEERERERERVEETRKRNEADATGYVGGDG